MAQDYETGLSGSASGQLSNPTEPASVPVQLEPSGTVSGTIRDASTAPVYNASISLFSSGVQFADAFIFLNRWSSSDDQGHYEVDRVALGEVAVTATAPPPVDWVPGYVGAAVGTLDSDGQTISVDVDLPPTSTIKGTVFAADGVTPAPYADLLVENDLLPERLSRADVFTSASNPAACSVAGPAPARRESRRS